MSYQKLIESKVIRVKHVITFRVGSSAADLADYLKHVPIEARITDFNNEDDELSIEFLQEKEEAK